MYLHNNHGKFSDCMFLNGYYIVILFTSTYHGAFPISPLIPYKIRFVHRGFTEGVAIVIVLPRFWRGFTAACTLS